ncbi:MAG: hypothetical protein ACOY5W_01120 [Pseudomonadota bacterium]
MGETVVCGFGHSAVAVISEVRRLFLSGDSPLARITLARQAAFTIDGSADVSSVLVGEEAVIAARQTWDSVIIIVDQSDADAVRHAAKAGDASREAGSSLVVGICSELVASDRLETTLQPDMQRSLRTALDSLVMVETGSHPGNDRAQVTRVAYTLVAATLGHRVNLIDIDLSDLKEALRGWAVAAVTRNYCAETKMIGGASAFDGRIDLTPSLAENPRGLFCSYGASLDRLRLEDFESVGSVIQEELRRVYPMHDVTIVVACLADNSLDQASEVVTCLAFDG